MKNQPAQTRKHLKLSSDDILPVATSHQSGTKKILSAEIPQPVVIKQVAIGKLEPGELVPSHVHPDMDEHYMIMSGNGWMRIDEAVYLLKKGDFMIVTAGSDHELHCTDNSLEFFYQSFAYL